MATAFKLPAKSTPLPPLARKRIEKQIERLLTKAQALIANLDEIDGDPDLEDDDPSGQNDEDGINTGLGHWGRHGAALTGPGCPLSDPGEPIVSLTLNPDVRSWLD